MIKATCLFMTLTPLIIFADIASEMMDFYHSCGSAVNKSSPEIYNGQKAGYMTGGSMVVKNKVKTMSPYTVTFPSVKGSCNGIDIYTGGFSFVNSDQLIDMMKAIGSNSAGYAFNLAIQTISPQISGTLTTLEDWAIKINSHNINSCHVAEGLVNSLRVKNQTADQVQCRTTLMEDGDKWGYTEANGECASPQKNNEASKETSINVAWEAIKLHSSLSRDKSLAEIFMNLTGTIIYSNESIIHIPSKASDETYLKKILYGGIVEIQRCKHSDKCLDLNEESQTILFKDSLVEQVRRKLISMQQKIIDDCEFDADEQDLINKTRLPLFNIVNILASYRKGGCPIDLYSLAELIASDIMIDYMREVIDMVRSACLPLKYHHLCDANVDEFIKHLSTLEDRVNHYELRTKSRMELESLVLKRIQILEDHLSKDIQL